MRDIIAHPRRKEGGQDHPTGDLALGRDLLTDTPALLTEVERGLVNENPDQVKDIKHHLMSPIP